MHLNGGILACDSCWSYGDIVNTLSKKIRRLKSGALLGEAGDFDTREIVTLLDNVATFDKLPTLKTLQKINLAYTGLLILPDGTKYQVETKEETDEEGASAGIWRIEDNFTAIGSGRPLALGAMAFGATARQAVAIACKYDINSRLPIHSLRLKSIDI